MTFKHSQQTILQFFEGQQLVRNLKSHAVWLGWICLKCGRLARLCMWLCMVLWEDLVGSYTYTRTGMVNACTHIMCRIIKSLLNYVHYMSAVSVKNIFLLALFNLMKTGLVKWWSMYPNRSRFTGKSDNDFSTTKLISF